MIQTLAFTFIPDATDSSSTFSGTFLVMLSSVVSSFRFNYFSRRVSFQIFGQVLIGNGTNGDMELATLTAGEGLDVTNGDGSITLSKMQLLLIKVSSFSASYFSVSSGDVSIADATTSSKGIFSFDSDNFTLTSGDVAITAIDGGTF